MAYDVATLQLKWKKSFDTAVRSVSCHDALVFVTAKEVPLTLLHAEDGSVVHTIDIGPGDAYSHSILTGVFDCAAFRVM